MEGYVTRNCRGGKLKRGTKVEFSPMDDRQDLYFTTATTDEEVFTDVHYFCIRATKPTTAKDIAYLDMLNARIAEENVILLVECMQREMSMGCLLGKACMIDSETRMTSDQPTYVEFAKSRPFMGIMEKMAIEEHKVIYKVVPFNAVMRILKKYDYEKKKYVNMGKYTNYCNVIKAIKKDMEDGGISW